MFSMKMKNRTCNFAVNKNGEKMGKMKTMLIMLATIGLTSANKPETMFMVKGHVVDDSGMGIAGVVVNNGSAFVRTDWNGKWELPTDTTVSKFVSISTPAEYHLPSENGMAAGFYKPIGKAVATSDNVFRLRRRSSKAKKFSYIAISDPQILDEAEMKMWRTETVRDLKATAHKLGKKGEVVAMALGDLVFDNMKLFGQYATTLHKSGMTVFQCIGNHDFNKAYPDLQNSQKGAAHYAEQIYERYFGPVNYSFNIGDAHIVTIKNIYYKGRGRYKEYITKHDLEWLRKDLSYVRKGSLVILNMHAPAWNSMGKKDNIDNAAELEKVLAGYKVHVFCGHTHFFENVEVSPSLYQHNIGAACGAWWSGNVNRCGAPNGFMVVNIDGQKVSWTYKPTGGSEKYQMRVYAPGTFALKKNYIVANVWDWDPKCSVEWYQDGKYAGKMTQAIGSDPEFMKTRYAKDTKCRTRHLFIAKPKGEYKSLKVVFTNRFGNRFTWEGVRRRG